MKEEKIKVTETYTLYGEGKLLPEDEREDITEQCVYFDDNLAVGRISLSKQYPIKVYGFGGNAPVSVHVSVPYPMTPEQEQEAIKYADKLCETELDKSAAQYKEWLHNHGVDWEKVENNIK